MVTPNYCPDCNDPLNPGAKKCPCGWRVRGRNGKTAAQCAHDGRCQFILGGRRCPLPGNVCSSIVAPGPWFCAYHSKNRGEGRLAAEALDEIERGQGTDGSPRDWRVEMVDERIRTLELIQRDGEARSALIARCYAEMPKDLLSRLGLLGVAS